LVTRDDTPDNVWKCKTKGRQRGGLSVEYRKFICVCNNQNVIEDLNLKVGKGEHIFIKAEGFR
jgi:ABC-type molybdenum transport system ATPase subunit/photorepair protein PhrA